MSKVAVLGIGNRLHGDDGVGIVALHEIADEGLLPEADLFDAGTAPSDRLDIFLLHDTVVVVDAVCTGREPGTLYRVSPEALDRVTEGTRFAHGMGIPDTVRMARKLGSTATVIVLGLEPKSSDASLDLSEEVRHSLPALVEAVCEEVRHAGC